MLTFNRDNLRASRQRLWFAIDLVMLVLLVVNLLWLLFDSLYAVTGVRNLLQAQAPSFTEAYAPIHDNFLFYDLIFVSIFLSEFMVRWVHAVVKGVYQRWYFYPFIHWYDLIGCIPTSGARILRVLRIFSIIYRLHRYGIIDVTQTRLFQFFQFYYEAILEELTDRIVIKVLSGTQKEVQRGSPVLHRVQQDVLMPRRRELVDWLSAKVAEGARRGYVPNQAELRGYLEFHVTHAMQQNRDLKPLRQLPIVGSWASHRLDRAVGDIVSEVIHRVLSDLATRENHDFIEDLVAVFLDEREEASSEVDQKIIDAVVEVLELVKDQVRIKHWREELDKGRQPV